MVELEALIPRCQKSALFELCFLVNDSSFWMMATPNDRARRADSGMPEISSSQALLFAKYSSFWMMDAPEGRAQRADSDMPDFSSI